MMRRLLLPAGLPLMLLVLLVLLLAAAQTASAQSLNTSSPTFIRPRPDDGREDHQKNLVWYVGYTEEVRWHAGGEKNLTLQLCQFTGADNKFEMVINFPKSEVGENGGFASYNWTIPPLQDGVYTFALNNGTEVEYDIAYSESFNITTEGAEPTETAAPETGLSKPATIGISVGATVGGLLLLLGLGFLAWRKQWLRRKHMPVPTSDVEAMGDGHEKGGRSDGGSSEAKSVSPVSATETTSTPTTTATTTAVNSPAPIKTVESWKKPELPDSALTEVQGSEPLVFPTVPGEMDATSRPSELDASPMSPMSPMTPMTAFSFTPSIPETRR